MGRGGDAEQLNRRGGERAEWGGMGGHPYVQADIAAGLFPRDSTQGGEGHQLTAGPSGPPGLTFFASAALPFKLVPGES